jgi:hypothetical protein
MPHRYVHRPTEVTAAHVKLDNLNKIAEAMGAEIINFDAGDGGGRRALRMADATLVRWSPIFANPGDYIIIHDDGKHEVVGPTTFESRYERID